MYYNYRAIRWYWLFVSISSLVLFLNIANADSLNLSGWILKSDSSLAQWEAEDIPSPYSGIPAEASGGQAILLDNRYLTPVTQSFMIEKNDNIEIWARVRFNNGGANSFFVQIDDGKRKMISSESFNDWIWIRIANGINHGSHKLILSRREPSYIDSLILYKGKDFTKESIYKKTYPVGLPLCIPNELPLQSAPESGIWSILGIGAEKAEGSLNGHDLDGRGYANRVKWKGSGILYLMLRDNKSVFIHAGLLPRECPQQLIVPCRISNSVDVDAVFNYGAGKYIRVPGTLAKNRNYITFDLLNVRYAKPIPVPMYLAGFILTVKHGLDFSWGHPELVKTASLKAFIGKSRGSNVGWQAGADGKVMLQINSKRLINGPEFVRVVLKTTEFDKDAVKDTAITKGSLKLIRIVPGKPALVKIKAPLKNKIYLCHISAGMRDEQRVMFAGSSVSEQDFKKTHKRWTKKLGGYEFPEAKFFKGKRSEVKNDYGKKYRVEVKGKDITSRKHADRLNIPPLTIQGLDLSDEAGWPDIYIKPGIMAVDPETHRIKVYPETKYPFEFLGVGLSGFGVPGSGRVLVSKGFCYIPGGEGDTQIIDVRDPYNPKRAAIIESPYFYHGFVGIGNRLFFNASHGVGLVMINDVSDPFNPGSMSAVGRGDKGSIIGSIPKTSYAIFNTREGLQLAEYDKANGFNFIGKPIIKGRGALAGDSLWVTTEEGSGPKLKGYLHLYKLSNPIKPILKASSFLEKGSQKNNIIFEKIISTGQDWTITGDSTHLTIYKETLKGIRRDCILDVASGVKGVIVIRDAGLINGRWLIILDGRQSSSQHALNSHSPSSRLIVYDLETAKKQNQVDSFLDNSDLDEHSSSIDDLLGIVDIGEELKDKPIYQNDLPKLLSVPVAIYVDKQPSEYANLTLNGSFAYINDYDYGLVIFDMKDPRNPKKISMTVGCGEGRIGGYAGGGLAYIGQTFGGSIIAYDISDPIRPEIVGNYWDGEWNLYWSRFAGKGRILYAARDYSVKIIDFTNPASPVEVGTFKDIDGKPLEYANPYVWDNTVCIAVGGHSSHKNKDCPYIFYDISDPLKPKLKSRLILKGPPGNIVQMAYKDGKLICLDAKRLRVLDVSNLNKPKLLGEVTEEDVRKIDPRAHMDVYQGNVENICLAGNFAYTAFCDNKVNTTGILQFDISDPVHPVFVKLFDPQPKKMWVSWPDFYGDYITYGNYMMGGNYGQIEFFDISNPSLPKHIATKSRGYQWSCGIANKGILYVPSLSGLTTYRLPISDQIGGNPQITPVKNR